MSSSHTWTSCCFCCWTFKFNETTAVEFILEHLREAPFHLFWHIASRRRASIVNAAKCSWNLSWTIARRGSSAFSWGCGLGCEGFQHCCRHLFEPVGLCAETGFGGRRRFLEGVVTGSARCMLSSVLISLWVNPSSSQGDEKWCPRRGFEKIWFAYWFLVPKWEAINCKKDVFALYML